MRSWPIPIVQGGEGLSKGRTGLMRSGGEEAGRRKRTTLLPVEPGNLQVVEGTQVRTLEAATTWEGNEVGETKREAVLQW